MHPTLFVICLIVGGLVVFDLIAVNLGVDSRPVENSRPNW
jgi:hypothetical protein